MKNCVGLSVKFIALNERFGKFTSVLFHLFMGCIWMGAGAFFLYDYFISKKVDFSYKEHPLWIPFNLVAILYGIWRFSRAYTLYKKQ